MLEGNPPCELGPKFREVLPSYDECTGRATCLHELRKRSQGGSIIDVSNIMRSCTSCNGYVELEPYLAHRAGLVKRAGDV